MLSADFNSANLLDVLLSISPEHTARDLKPSKLSPLRLVYAAAHAGESTTACSRTVCAAFSSLFGGYLCLRRMRLTNTRNCARALSRSAQSMVTLLRTAFTSSRAMLQSVSSPNTLTALSFVSSAS